MGGSLMAQLPFQLLYLLLGSTPLSCQSLLVLCLQGSQTKNAYPTAYGF